MHVSPLAPAAWHVGLECIEYCNERSEGTRKGVVESSSLEAWGIEAVNICLLRERSCILDHPLGNGRLNDSNTASMSGVAIFQISHLEPCMHSGF